MITLVRQGPCIPNESFLHRSFSIFMFPAASLDVVLVVVVVVVVDVVVVA